MHIIQNVLHINVYRLEHRLSCIKYMIDYKYVPAWCRGSGNSNCWVLFGDGNRCKALDTENGPESVDNKLCLKGQAAEERSLKK